MATLDQIIHAKAIALGKLALEATTAAGSGHPSSALSLAHLVTVLMYRVMRWQPQRPEHRGADRLVLSEGHAVPIVYAACADLGVVIGGTGQARPMTRDDLGELRDITSVLDGHPNPALGFPFFDAATGSLGQGLSIAAGLACAARLDGLDKVIYCLMGDGEAREGQIWEAMDFIADQRLTNVVAIFNANGLGQSDPVAPGQDWEHLQRKAEAFGWSTVVIDGHNPTEIQTALGRRTAMAAEGKPLAIVARTIKGWGVPALAGPGHHGVAVPRDKLAAALAALDAEAKALGADDIYPGEIAQSLVPASPAATPSAARRASEDLALPEEFSGAEKLSPRRAYGLALRALGEADGGVVALDGDTKNSTYAQDFARAFPDRYFEARIAEQNMVSVAAGLAAGGKIAFASSFGRFLERACDQIEMAVISGAPIKLVGSHVGVTLAADGPSQMALADLGFMRALAHARGARGEPDMTVLTPSDAVSAFRLVQAMASAPGACYLRALRADLPLLYGASERFPFGGHKRLREGARGGKRIVLVAAGYLVHSALAAAESLAERGIAATVLDAYSLPLDTGPVLELVTAQGGVCLTLEDAYVGGLGSELAEAAATGRLPVRLESLVVRRIPKSGRRAEDVLAYVGLSVADIAAAAEKLAR